MNNILIPIDFSDNSINALKYAINIANRFNSNIILLHCFEFKESIDIWADFESRIRREANEELAKIRKQFQSSLFRDTSLEVRVVEGNTVDNILKIASVNRVDMIVMGTQGASGFKQLFLGSNTTAVLKKAKIPVLVIPNNFTYRPIKEIAFAIDSKKIDRTETIQILKNMAISYKAHITAYHLIELLENVGGDLDLPLYLKSIPYEIIQTTDWKEVNGKINQYVAKSNADLLCMIHHKRSFLENIFHSSATEKEAFNSPVPLLVLQD